MGNIIETYVYKSHTCRISYITSSLGRLAAFSEMSVSRFGEACLFTERCEHGPGPWLAAGCELDGERFNICIYSYIYSISRTSHMLYVVYYKMDNY